MTKSQTLPYLQTMFGTCMLFQALYVLCIALWFLLPDLRGHTILTDLIPGFQLFDARSFFYGLIAMAVYGWTTAVIFAFFFNLWPSFVRLFSGNRTPAP